MNHPAPTIPVILLGDDDPEATEHLRDLLESWHYPVETLDDGHAVLHRLLDPRPPAVAILDMNLPSLSATDIVAEFRRRNHKNAVWIMLTGKNAGPDEISSASDAGVDDFLLKPVDELDLRVRLRTAERVQSIYSELHLQMEAVRFHSSHDRLTGLLNREALLSALFQETDRVQRMRTPLTLLLLDLDGFSQVNLEYGYAAGDRILQDLAQRFRRYLRSYDMVGRCGEDEFLMGLPGCSMEDAVSMAERLQETVLHRPFGLEHDAVTISASIGLAQSKGRSPLVVLREAERALAEAKLSGRNCIRAFGMPVNPVSALRTPLLVGSSQVAADPAQALRSISGD
ncbi:GGDEF domain-containing protein [Acidipila rosea]|uniref:diguanylate cyclase n=1 Tax=Acidipila rosea TaxID=768535 RepID=A0A4R1L6G5_9BACT|nr:diguanylate cyclase [Acidipila rosea]TCK73762.1 response regulator receiver modulated diguanylate cyclase [Acidipila rosea]